MLTKCHQWCHYSSYSIHSQLSHYKPLIYRLFWESEGQSNSVSRLDLAGAWVTERGDHFTPVRSHSHPAWAHWKTPIRGPAFAPTACLATTTPYPHIRCVYMYIPPPSPSPLHFFLILPQPLRSALSLTCILRGLFWHICPQLVMPLWLWISVWMLSIAAPADSLSDFLTGNRGAPVARIEKSDLSTRAAVACLDICPNASQIPGFCKLNGCLTQVVVAMSELGRSKSRGWKDWEMVAGIKGNSESKAEQHSLVHLST